MSSAPLTVAAPSLIDRLSDRLNPIFIKETRQALKSRQFLASFFLMLTASWMVATFGLLLSGSAAEFSRAGATQFVWFFNILCVATYVIVPFGAFRSILAERDQFTYEVLAISTLKPRQIVWGKLCSALLQTFIYYSAITPFMAFTYQLRGIDVVTIMFLLVLAMLISVALSLICLTISTFARQRAVQILLTLAVIVELLFAFGMNFSLSFSIGFMPFDDLNFWLMWGVLLTYYAAYFWLLMELAVSQLTFEADNRSTAVRLGFSLLLGISVAWIGLMIWGTPFPDSQELLTVFFFAAMFHWLFLGLFAVTEPDDLSRRTIRSLQRWGPLRVLLAPLLPGGARGLVFVLGHAVVTLLVALAADLFVVHVHTGGTSRFPGVWSCLAFTLFVVIYLGMACALSRWLQMASPDMRPAHARVFTILIIALVAVIPKLIILFQHEWQSVSLMMVGDPLTASAYLWEGRSNGDELLVLMILAAGAVLAIVVNLRAMLTGIVDVALADPAALNGAARLHSPS